MAYTIDNLERRKIDPSVLGKKNISYDYPEGQDWTPGGTLHEKVRNFILDKTEESKREVSKRERSWRKVDDSLRAYIPLSQEEKDVLAEDDRKAVSIVIPMSYATLDSLLSYWVATFLQSPIIKYDGHGPEDMLGAALLEKVIELQCIRNKVALGLYGLWKSAFSYGIGIVAPKWEVKYGYKTVMQSVTIPDLFLGQEVEVGKRRVVEEAILFEGNTLENISPYFYLPDPNVSSDRIQKGEFVGWVDRDNYYNMLTEERDSDNTIFNVRYLADGDMRSRYYERNITPGNEFITERGSLRIGTTSRPIDNIYMYVKVIPRELGLSSGEYPEKWLFRLSGDQVITMAKPLDLDHDMFPVAVCAPETDSFDTLPISILEIVYGMQKNINWQISTRNANVRKSLNDMFVVDPFLVNINDVADPRPGKLIRMRRHAWGRGVDNAIQQFKVDDVTKGYMSDILVFLDIWQRITGVSDQNQGLIRSRGERVSATEAGGSMAASAGRMAKSAKLGSIQALQDIGIMFAAHTQQFMSQEAWVKATGRWQGVLSRTYPNAEKIPVTPEDLLIMYDVIPHDGSAPKSNNINNLVQAFQMGSTNQVVTMRYDISMIFRDMMLAMGIKNIDDYEINVKMLPDQTVQKEVQAGNMIPKEEIPNAFEQ